MAVRAAPRQSFSFLDNKWVLQRYLLHCHYFGYNYFVDFVNSTNFGHKVPLCTKN